METFTYRRSTFKIEIVHDSDHGTPWENEDGHGPVSDWTSRAKCPGEMILTEDRGRKRFYDFAEACRIARRDGWNAAPYDVPGESKRQRAARAAMADFERLRAWCNDQWHYVGVVVTRLDRHGNEMRHERASLWGIESDCEDYQEEVARELAAEINAERAARRKAALREGSQGFASAWLETVQKGVPA